MKNLFSGNQEFSYKNYDYLYVLHEINVKDAISFFFPGHKMATALREINIINFI